MTRLFRTYMQFRRIGFDPQSARELAQIQEQIK